jgi:hypothetical protein
MYLAAVDSVTSISSISSSPCIRGAPHRGFSLLIRRNEVTDLTIDPRAATTLAGHSESRGTVGTSRPRSADRCSGAVAATEPSRSVLSPADEGQCFPPGVPSRDLNLDRARRRLIRNSTIGRSSITLRLPVTPDQVCGTDNTLLVVSNRERTRLKESALFTTFEARLAYMPSLRSQRVLFYFSLCRRH